MVYQVEERTTCKVTVDGEEKMQIERDHRTGEFELRIKITEGGYIYSKMTYDEILMLKGLIQYALDTCQR